MARTKRPETAPGWSESPQWVERIASLPKRGWSESPHPRARVATKCRINTGAHQSTPARTNQHAGAHETTRLSTHALQTILTHHVRLGECPEETAQACPSV
jgi:hypothetical protein